MVDDEFLKELLAKSFHPDEVAKRLGISGSDSDGWDWGALNGLGENCYISLGLKDNLPHPPNAQAEAFRLNEEEIKKIKQNSRHYAKRQYTFFNHQLPVVWFETDYNN